MSRKMAEAVRFHHLETPGRGKPVAGYIALVPGEDVPMLALQLPPGLQGNAREQVAWRQLQDQLALTVDTAEMRPYFGAEKALGWTKVLVVATHHMQRWRGMLDPGCRALLPDYLALPVAEDLWVLALRRGTVQARLGLLDGFSAEAELADLMLVQMLADETVANPRAVLLLEGTLPGLETLLAEAGIDLVHDTGGLKPLGINAPVVLGHGELAADLRIDARAARAALRRQLWPWGAALVAAGLMVGFWAAGETLTLRQMQRERVALHSNTETLVRDHFVPTGPLLDVRLQVSRALAARQAEVTAGAGRVSPLLLIGQVADVLVAAGVQPDLLHFGQAEGLVVELKVVDFAALDDLVMALAQAGITADPRDARVVEEGSGGVRAALYLQVKQAEVGQ